MNELFRIHKPGSFSYHIVDLHDHLGGALNSLRFSEKFWESPVVQNAGFYTNRLSMSEMEDMAKKAGFNVVIQKIIKWKELPTAHAFMNSAFRAKSADELNVCTFVIKMFKPK
jgi:hypothetical protein